MNIPDICVFCRSDRLVSYLSERGRKRTGIRQIPVTCIDCGRRQPPSAPLLPGVFSCPPFVTTPNPED